MASKTKKTKWVDTALHLNTTLSQTQWLQIQTKKLSTMMIMTKTNIETFIHLSDGLVLFLFLLSRSLVVTWIFQAEKKNEINIRTNELSMKHAQLHTNTYESFRMKIFFQSFTLNHENWMGNTHSQPTNERHERRKRKINWKKFPGESIAKQLLFSKNTRKTNSNRNWFDCEEMLTRTHTHTRKSSKCTRSKWKSDWRREQTKEIRKEEKN